MNKRKLVDSYSSSSSTDKNTTKSSKQQRQDSNRSRSRSRNNSLERTNKSQKNLSPKSNANFKDPKSFSRDTNDYKNVDNRTFSSNLNKNNDKKSTWSFKDTPNNYQQNQNFNRKNKNFDHKNISIQLL